MSYRISNDGETWYECPGDKFQEWLADEAVDFWVDWSEPGKPWVLQLSMIRALRKEAEGPTTGDPWKKPTTLYGIPIVYEGDA